MVSSLFSRPRDEDKSWVSLPSITCSIRERQNQASALSPRTHPPASSLSGPQNFSFTGAGSLPLTAWPCTQRPGAEDSQDQIPKSFWNPPDTIITIPPPKTLENATGQQGGCSAENERITWPLSLLLASQEEKEEQHNSPLLVTPLTTYLLVTPLTRPQEIPSCGVCLSLTLGANQLAGGDLLGEEKLFF